MAQALHYAVHLNTNGSTLIKTGFGTLGAITVNSRGSAGNTLSFYDGTSAAGTLLGVIDTTVAQGTYLYDLLLGTGLFIVMANGGAADVTVAWY